jgi:hypothetical protein
MRVWRGGVTFSRARIQAPMTSAKPTYISCVLSLNCYSVSSCLKSENTGGMDRFMNMDHHLLQHCINPWLLRTGKCSRIRISSQRVVQLLLLVQVVSSLDHCPDVLYRNREPRHARMEAAGGQHLEINANLKSRLLITQLHMHTFQMSCNCMHWSITWSHYRTLTNSTTLSRTTAVSVQDNVMMIYKSLSKVTKQVELSTWQAHMQATHTTDNHDVAIGCWGHCSTWSSSQNEQAEPVPLVLLVL